MSVRDYVAGKLQDGTLKMACEDPDNPINFPRNLFLWRSNLLGSSGKGHEYMLRHLMGAQHGCSAPTSANQVGRDRRKSRGTTRRPKASSIY